MSSVDRVEPPVIAEEREMTRAFLDYQRATLALKFDGLSDADLRRRAAQVSTLSLLGLIRHLAEVERTWFRRVINGEDIPLLWSSSGDVQAAFDTDDADAATAIAAWRQETAHARRIELAALSFEVTGYFAKWERDISLRWVMLHLIHEYARHNGHADMLREAIDGAVGR